MVEERRRNEFLEVAIKRAVDSSIEIWRANEHKYMQEYNFEEEEVVRHAEYRKKRDAGKLQLPFTLDESEKINDYQSKWDNLITSIKPVDIRRVENEVKLFYSSLGLKSPLIVWCDSPLQSFIYPLASKKKTLKTVFIALEASDQFDSHALSLASERFKRLLETCESMSSTQLETVSSKLYNKIWESAAVLRRNIEESLEFEKFASLKYEYSGYKTGDFLLVKSILEHTENLINSSFTKQEKKAYSGSFVKVKLGWSNIGELSGPAIMYGAMANCFPEVLSEETKPFEYWLKMHELAPAYYFTNGICFVANRPLKLLLNDAGDFHSDLNEAIRFSDGFKLYFYSGRLMPKDVMTNYDNITIERIEGCRNIEVRQIMVSLYGPQKYIKESGAEVVHKDEFGVLYHKHFTDGVCEAMVRVTNSTREPDGTWKDYFIRVPPHLETAKAAVAWTFGFDEDEYNPLEET